MLNMIIVQRIGDSMMHTSISTQKTEAKDMSRQLWRRIDLCILWQDLLVYRGHQILDRAGRLFKRRTLGPLL